MCSERPPRDLRGPPSAPTSAPAFEPASAPTEAASPAACLRRFTPRRACASALVFRWWQATHRVCMFWTPHSPG